MEAAENKNKQHDKTESNKNTDSLNKAGSVDRAIYRCYAFMIPLRFTKKSFADPM